MSMSMKQRINALRSGATAEEIIEALQVGEISEHAKLDSIRDLCQSSLEIDGSSKPGVDLASVLSQILNIATNGQEGDKPMTDTDVLELATLSERLDTVIQEMRVVGATPSLMNDLVGISAEIR